MTNLTALPNIGKNIALRLQEVGISSPEQLYEAGSREAWLRIRAVDPTVCINFLCALEGAVQGIRWHDIPPQTKAELKEFYEANKEPSQSYGTNRTV